jgi:hypothetical protein
VPYAMDPVDEYAGHLVAYAISCSSLPLTYKKGSMKPSPPLTGSASASPPSPPLTGLALASQPHSRLRHRRHPNRLTGLASAVPPSLPLTGSALVSKISKPRSSGFATQDFFIWLLYEYYYKIKVPALCTCDHLEVSMVRTSGSVGPGASTCDRLEVSMVRTSGSVGCRHEL